MTETSEYDSESRFRAEQVDHLLETQKAALRIILGWCAKIILRAEKRLRQAKRTNDPNELLPLATPHEVFCIDGGRGSGKTFTLVSLQNALGVLSNGFREPSPAFRQWEGFLREAIGESSYDKLSEKAQELRDKKSRPAPLSESLRIIFPGDMEGGESVMEAIFAALMDRLDKLSDKSLPKACRLDHDHAERLRKRLKEVAEGFYFAKRFGVDAIVRDSVDYRDLVDAFEKHSRTALQRITAWRDFIDDYLEVRGIPVLVIFLDDSDVEVDLTRDILHSIRMFLCHPQIITILAGNTRSMRDSLIHLGMRHIGPSMAALGQSNARTAQDWRRMVRKDAEYYLEKVLPQERRCFIGPPELTEKAQGAHAGDDLPSDRNDDTSSDFAKIARAGLREILTKRQNGARGGFLEAKFTLAIEYELDRSDAPTMRQRRRIEDYLAWWFFANRYAGPLAPRSARQIKTFYRYYGALPEPDKHKPANDAGTPQEKKAQGKKALGKRLPVMLHDIPENYTLIQRLSDEDVNVVGWLWQQELKSVWAGQRNIRINGRAVYQGTYTYDYIRYRLDVNVATPLRTNADEAVPPGLLPQVRGRRYMRRFFQPQQMQRQQRRIGIARWIDHAAVPGNCAYFCDLAALPDMSFIRGPAGESRAADAVRASKALDDELNRGAWEGNLAGHWVELLEEEQDEKLVRYLTEVVCDRLNGTQGVLSTRLMSDLHPLRSEYHEFVRKEMTSFTPAAADEFSPAIWEDAKAFLKKPISELEKYLKEAAPGETQKKRENLRYAQQMIARYVALITDLRRAWHAIRIHATAPRWMESGDTAGASQETERTSLAMIANQGRMPLYTRDEILKLLNRTPWIRGILEAFKLKNIETKLNDIDFRSAQEDNHEVNLTTIRNFYVFQLVGGEKEDYGRWTKVLRGFGRCVCEGWPVHDKTNYDYLNAAEKSLERHVVPESLRLDISFSLIETDGSSKKSEEQEKEEKKAREQQLRNGREARNLIWLLYGLAPSLSAIIHSEVMAEIYHGISLKVQAGEPEPAGARLTPDRESIDNALRSLDDWARLIGVFSLIVRYVKVKCLHLYTKIALEQMRGAEYPQGPETLEDARRVLLSRCGFETTPEGAKAVIKFLHTDVFGEKTSTDLALMPDVSPSTLFGEKWLTDLINTEGVRNRIKDHIEKHVDRERMKRIVISHETLKAGKSDIRPLEERVRRSEDNPLEVRGMLSETEQWLWATNRGLSKLRNEITEAFKTELQSATANPQ